LLFWATSPRFNKQAKMVAGPYGSSTTQVKLQQQIFWDKKKLSISENIRIQLYFIKV